MERRKVRIANTSDPRAEGIWIDGEFVKGVRSINLNMSRMSGPVIELELSIPEIAVDLDQSEVNLYLPENVQETLVKFGWTPPKS